MPQHRVCLYVLVLFLIPHALGSNLSARTPKRLVLVTYNIHHGESVDGVLSLQGIADAIRHADIAALQEVDNQFGTRSDFVNQAESLAKLLNMYYVFAPNLDLNASTVTDGKIRSLRRQYGTAILSRYPIDFSRNYLLPKIKYVNVSSEQRGLLETQLDIDGRPLRVYCTHLSSTTREQRILQVKSVQTLVGQAGQAGAPEGNRPLASSFIVMGDFNFSPDSEEYSLLTGTSGQERQLIPGGGFVDSWALVGESKGHTIGVRGARGARIDYIFLSSDLAQRCVSARVDTETSASDHQPLTAVLEGF